MSSPYDHDDVLGHGDYQVKAGNKAVGHPVNVATGEVFRTFMDVQIPGCIALKWERRYSTSILQTTPSVLGPGWAIPYFSSLNVTEGGIDLITLEGERARFDDPDNFLDHGEKIIHYDTFQELEKRGDEYCLTQWNIDTGHVERFYYGIVPGSDSAFRLIRIEDVTGQSIDVEWNSLGQLQYVRQRLEGRSLSFTYVQGELLDEVTLHGSKGETRLVAKHDYDEFGRLIKVTDSIGRIQRYAYDKNSRLTREVLKDGGVFTFKYDPQGRCVRTSGLDNFDAKTFRYLDSMGFTQGIDSRGYTSIYQWLPSGQIVAEVDALSGRKETEYDKEGRIIALTNPNGGVITYEYDEKGNRSKITNPSGAVTESRYNHLHQSIEFTDPGGQKWLRTYDSQGNWISATDPEGRQWRFARNQNGQVVAITNPNGSQRQLFYNHKGILTGSTDWMGRLTKFQFDGFGHLISQTDVDGKTTKLTRDQCDRIISIQTRESGKVCYHFDEGDNLTAIIDQGGRSRRFRYATCGRLVEETDALGQRVQYAWGTEPKHLEKIINENGETYLFEYDAAGRVKKRVTFDGRIIEREYDPAGNCIAECRNSELTINYEYNRAGQLVKRKTAGEEAVFGYDTHGRLVSAVNEAISIKIERDYRGQVIKEQQGEHTLNYQYDPLGQLLSLESSLGHRTDYTYDANGDLRSLRTSDGGELKFDFDKMRRETRRELPNGLELWQQYNDRGQLTTQNLGRHGEFPSDESASRQFTSQSLLKREYEYDITGMLTALSDTHWGTQSYEYDPNDRLTTVNIYNARESFTYNPAGNLISAGRTNQPTQHFSYGRGNRLESEGDFRFEYDEFGRQVKKNQVRKDEESLEWLFEWNGSDQLVSLVTPRGERWTYKYDPFGRRISKYGPDCKIEFVWDKFDVIHEKKDEKVRTWIHDEHSFKLLAQIEDNQFYAVITDHLGTPREMIDRSGRIAWRSNHWAWGERIASDGIWNVDCPWNFPGQYTDEESGLYHNCLRYYDPFQARYISPDPFELLGGLNEFSYCKNPVNWIDPYGLNECDDEEEYVYQLKKDGKVIYYGITNNPKRRAGEHANGKEPNTPAKDFDTMEVLTDKLSHNNARNLEAKLIRDRIDSEGVNKQQSVKGQLDEAGLLNRNRGRETDIDKKRGAPYGDDSLIKDESDRTIHNNPKKTNS